MSRDGRFIHKDYNTGSVYHCLTSTRFAYLRWSDQEKAILQRQVWQTTAFCGLELLSYCIMSRHIHLLVRVISGRSSTLSEAELWPKVESFYHRPIDAVVRSRLRRGLFGQDAGKREATRRRLLKLMDDLSVFMKLLKQRFSAWYNLAHGSSGTHWYDRFQSRLIQDTTHDLSTTSAYIALKPVRIGICRDAADYRFSSYAEALQGHAQAIRALCSTTRENTGPEALATFRAFLQKSPLPTMDKAMTDDRRMDPD